MKQVTVNLHEQHYGVLSSWADDYETTVEDILRKVGALFWTLNEPEKVRLLETLKRFS